MSNGTAFILMVIAAFIVGAEMVVILYFLSEYYCGDHDCLIFSSVILIINIIPAIFIDRGKGFFFVSSFKTIFAISSVFSILEVIIFMICYFLCDFDVDDCLAPLCFSLIVFIIIFTGIFFFTDIESNSIVEIDKKSYTEYYKIYCDDEGKPNISYVTYENNKGGKYVVVYESKGERGETKLNFLQLSPVNTDIVFATEEQDDNYLFVYVTENIKEDRSKDPPEQIIDKSYSYKIIVKRGIPLINIIPPIE